MEINEFLNKKIQFERIVEFPKTPVMLFEPMSRSYEQNDYAQKLGINYQPTGIVLQDENYEGWIDLTTKIKIADLDTINQIIVDVRLYNEEAKNALNQIAEQARSLSNIAGFTAVISQLAKINSNIYSRFVFFTDELFAITDENKIHELQSARMELDDLVSNYLWKVYLEIIKILNKKFQIDVRVLENATNEEIIKILEKRSDVDIAAIIDRPIAFGFINGDKTIFTGKNVLKIKEYLSAQNPEQILAEQARREGIISGQIGNMGKTKGKVIKLLVTDYHNQGKLDQLDKENDYILVTPMTQPELVSFMKKAAAFVTDEGGITCHAAIIARELKKPCIIGTKIATKVLKDGDMVEVDADNGLVKIIK